MLKNRKVVLGLTFLGIVVVSFLLARRATRDESLKLPGSISLGSSPEDVEEALGEPQKVSENSYLFDSSSLSRKNEATFSDEELAFFREVVTENDEKTIAGLVETYGAPEATLYNEMFGGGYVLYANPSQGVAYIGKPGTGSVFEIWYFAPTTTGEFREKYAKDYVDDPSEIITI